MSQNKPLKVEILTVFKSGGEQGVRNFMEKRNTEISNPFILGFAMAAVKERNETWLKICDILAREKNDEKIIADVLYQKAKYYMLTGDNQKATYCLDKAFPMYLKLNDSVGRGHILLGKGWILFHIGKHTQAFEMFEKAMTFYKKENHLRGQGNVYMNKGTVYLYAGDNSNALKMYNKAETFFEKAGYAPGLGAIFQNKGTIHLNRGELVQALEMYQQALPFFQEENDSRKQGIVYWNLGQVYLRLGKGSKASEMIGKARMWFDIAKAPQGQGRTCITKAKFFLITGATPKAFEMYDNAMAFFEKCGDITGMGEVFHAKGMVYFSMGINSKALEMLDRALPLFKKSNAIFCTGNTFLLKGIIYRSDGNPSKAMEMYRKALFFYEKAGEPISLGNVYFHMAEINNEFSENSKALETYDRALSYYTEAQHPVGLGNTYSGKGDVFSRMGEYTKALDVYDKALIFFKKAGGIRGSASMVLHCKGRVLTKLGKKEEAAMFFEQAIANLETLRARTAFSEMKRTLMEKILQQYEEIVLFMLENNYNGKGFKYCESMRARVFLDRMAEGLVRLDKGLPANLREKRDKLVIELSRISKEMHETPNKKDSKRSRELKDKYQKTENELDDILVQIRLNNSLYAQVRYPQPISVSDLQQDVLKKNELVLRYFISPKKTYVFLVSRDTFRVIPFDITITEINHTVAAYLRGIKERNASHIRRYGNTLYRKLFKPLEPEIKQNKEIIIIPDGQLATIPFESLIIKKNLSGRPMFLLEKYRIKYIQSASLLSILRKYYRRTGEKKAFAGFGDPVYNYQNYMKSKSKMAALAGSGQDSDELRQVLRSRYTRSGGTLHRLPHSGEEVRAVADLFKKYGHNATVFSREQATEENAKATQMNDYDFIHFACHGLLNDDFQSLVLSRLPSRLSHHQPSEDGYFTLNEIMNCHYNAKLIVLSACRTGSGKMDRAEGVTGLTRAVMYAGTPAVIASLWSVDDQATKKLMLHFYENLLEKNISKTDALRQAKLAMIKDERYVSPFYWSAFVMYGE